MSRRGISILTLMLLVVSILSFAAGYWARDVWPLTADPLALVQEARRLLGLHYLDPLPDELELERGMIYGMMGILEDPYSVYIKPEAHEIQSDELAGEYAGIGADIYQDEDGKFFLVPIEGAPADTAGIQEGDILVAIDGTFLDSEISISSVITLIRGPVDTVVHLTVAPRVNQESSLGFDITRALIPLPSVTQYLIPDEDGIGVIGVRRFSDKTPSEIEDAFEEIIHRGAKSVILDLRDNPGGLLDASIDSARIFLNEGLVVVEERSGDENQVFYVTEKGPASEIPLVVLANERTASAAEVVAAAIQDNDRAIIIGERTFGKGSVQAILELSDGSSLHVTSARWLTPKGNVIDEQGLIPDIVVEQIESTADNFIAVAVEWLREQSENDQR